MPLLPITSLYILPLAIIYLILFFQVIFKRSELSVSIGEANDTGLHERVRRHGNFVECVPFVLILMMLNEANATQSLWLHMAGALLTIGRIIHPFGLKANNPSHPLRIIGNMGSIFAILILTINLGLRSFSL